jgi:hypothetical protein
MLEEHQSLHSLQEIDLEVREAKLVEEQDAICIPSTVRICQWSWRSFARAWLGSM